MKVLIKLFISFLRIGGFSFGGGYAMIPFIQREVVEQNNWISIKQFLDIIGISQMTPGPIAINTATFVGYTVYGVLGGITATIGVVIVSFILVLLLSEVMQKLKESEIITGALKGMRPVLVALIIKAFIDLGKESYVDLESIIITLIIGIILLSKKVHPILVIIISGILGLILYIK